MIYIFLLLAKSAKTAMLLTTFVPGGGQFYTERYVKGIIIGGTQSYLLYKGIQTQIRLNEIEKDINALPQEKQNLLDQRRQFAWWMTLAWTLGILDAYIDAQLYNFESNMSFDRMGGVKAEISFKIHY
jgi:TM2 domain-containing membrane protein YozV